MSGKLPRDFGKSGSSMKQQDADGALSSRQCERILAAIDTQAARIISVFQNLPDRVDRSMQPQSQPLGEQGTRKRQSALLTTLLSSGKFANMLKGNSPIQVEQPDQDDRSIQRLEERHARLIQSLKDKQNTQAEILNKDLKDAEQQVNDGRLQLRSSQETVQDLQGTVRTLQDNVVGLREQNTALHGRVATLRNFVIKKANDPTDAVSDETLRQKFADLGSQIDAIVRKFWGMVDWPLVAIDGTIMQQEMYRLKEMQMPDPQLKNRLRATIFSALQLEIFDTICFSADTLDADGLIEDGLSSFERKLDCIRESHEELFIEWRTATMKCAKMLSSGAANRHLELSLYEFLQPFVLEVLEEYEDLMPQRTRELQDRLRKLCEDARKLHVLLRTLKDEYMCQMPGLTLSFEEAELCDSEREDRGMEEGSRIAYVIFGMLVKRPLHEPRDIMVLQKAQVVIGD